VRAAAAGGGSECAGVATPGGSERGGITGAMPSRVCLRSGLLPTIGVALADGGVEAAISGFEGATRGVEIADGRPTDSAAAGLDGRGAGAEEARGGIGVAEARGGAGVTEARGGAGVTEVRGGAEGRAAGGEDGRGAGVDGRGAGVAVAGAAATCGKRAGAGISSAPHSESMSSVGGAMEGIGGLPLTRSLSDRLSVIALTSPFHGRPHKSSMCRKQRLMGAAGTDLSVIAALGLRLSAVRWGKGLDCANSSTRAADG
jgi:hypothetical protein